MKNSINLLIKKYISIGTQSVKIQICNIKCFYVICCILYFIFSYFQTFNRVDERVRHRKIKRQSRNKLYYDIF